MKVHILRVLVVVCALSIGCRAEHRAAVQQQAIAVDAPDPSPETYALGVTVTADGSVPKDATIDAFPRGRQVFLSIDVSGAHIEQTIAVKWLDDQDRVLGTETRNVPVGAHYAAFSATPEVTARAGKHRAVVVINGRVVSQKEFSVL